MTMKQPAGARYGAIVILYIIPTHPSPEVMRKDIDGELRTS